MRVALRAARDGARRGEIPVGAVIVDRRGMRVASGSNRTLRESDPTAHAEIVVMRRAARRVANHRLTGMTLYCTLEPCPMCLGALIQARVGRLVYAADDPKGGGISNGHLDRKGFNHRLDLRQGVLREEAADLLRRFFRVRRGKNRKPRSRR